MCGPWTDLRASDGKLAEAIGALTQAGHPEPLQGVLRIVARYLHASTRFRDDSEDDDSGLLDLEETHPWLEPLFSAFVRDRRLPELVRDARLALARRANGTPRIVALLATYDDFYVVTARRAPARAGPVRHLDRRQSVARPRERRRARTRAGARASPGSSTGDDDPEPEPALALARGGVV